MCERFDTAIIGTGPAGLSAALTLKVRNKNIVLFGNENLSEKIKKAQEIKNYLGLPAIKGSDLVQKFREHLETMNIEITKDIVTTVYFMGDYYSILTKSNKMYEAASVIIATGVSFGKPYEGEEKFLGRGVSFCATCDAMLYKDKTVAVIASSSKEESEAEFLKTIAEKVYYIPTYSGEISLNEEIEIIREKPVAIEGTQKADRLVLQGSSLDVDGIFILRDSISPKNFVTGIEMEDNHIKVNRNLETNLKGCFACGDITGTPYQYMKAAGEGNVAALSAVQYLNR